MSSFRLWSTRGTTQGSTLKGGFPLHHWLPSFDLRWTVMKTLQLKRKRQTRDAYTDDKRVPVYTGRRSWALGNRGEKKWSALLMYIYLVTTNQHKTSMVPHDNK
jgi:hypothetical protein